MIDFRHILTAKVTDVNNPNQLSWAQIYYEIAKELNLLDPSNGIFQFMSGFTKADWDQNTLNAYTLAINLPLNSGPYFEKSDNYLTLDYSNFLNSIVCPDMDKEPGYVDAKNKKQLAMDNLNNIDFPKAHAAYIVWKTNPTDPSITTFDLWLRSSESGSWKSIIESDQSQIDYYAKIMASYVTAIQAPLARDIQAYTNATKQTIVGPNNAVLQVPVTNIHPDLSTTVDKWKLGQGISVHIDSTASTSQTSTWNIINSSTIDFSTFFGGFSNETNSWIYQEISSDSEFHMCIDIAGVLNFFLERPEWYDGSIFKMYWNGPYANPKFGPDFFSKDGILVLVPTQMLVGYGISATLTVSNNFYSQYQQSWNEFTEIRVGPFIFTIGRGASMSIKQNANNTVTLTLEDTSQTPYIIGVLSTLNKYY